MELASTGSVTFRSDSSDTINGTSSIRGNYGDRIKFMRRQELLLNPMKWKDECRSLLNKEYGVPLPSKKKVSRFAGKRVVLGVRRNARLSRPNRIIPKANRNNPALQLPPVTEEDMKQGLYNLQVRGAIPRTIDLTAVLIKEPSPVSAEQVVLHSHEEQHIRRPILAESDFGKNIIGVKLDVMSFAQESLKPSKPPEKKVHATVIPIGDQKIVGPLECKSPVEQEEKKETKEIKFEDVVIKQKDYDEMLDEFSLHRLIVFNGKIQCETPEYISFNRTYADRWGQIQTVLLLIEKVLSDFDVPLAYVDGKKVAQLAENDLEIPTVDQLLSCLVNYDDVLPLIKLPGTKFKGKHGTTHAAVMIQKVYRGYRMRKRYKILQEKQKAVFKIQKQWKLRKQFLSTQKTIKDNMEVAETAWRKVMDDFKRDWKNIQKNQRIIIHLPSLSYNEFQRKTIPNYQFIQNSQLLRICIDLMDENVDIIYISPVPLDEEGLQYVYKLLQLMCIKNPEKRFNVIYPDSYSAFEKSSLTSSLFYSTRTIRRIKALIRGKPAYIVPNVVGLDELRVALKLQIPMLGPDPVKSVVYGTKSGARRIFNAANVNVPFGTPDVYEEAEILTNLTKQIVQHPEFQRWILKVDNEFGGRGIAYLDVERVKCLSEAGRTEIMEELKKEKKENTYLDVLLDKLYFELRESLASRVKIVSEYVYPTWKEFVMAFKKHGGVIEAVPPNVIGSPTVNILIAPDGEINIMSVQEQLLNPQYVNIGAAFPQTSVPFKALRDASIAIGQRLYNKNVMGYASIDYVVFIAQNKQLKLWAVDLKLHLTDNALYHQICDYVTGGKMNPWTGDYVKYTPGQELSEYVEPDELYNRCYVYIGLMRHPTFPTWHHTAFFNQCRQKGISFDIQNRTGTIFHLVETLLRGTFGVLCVHKSTDEAIATLSDVISFISSKLEDDYAGVKVNEESNFQSVVSAVKLLVAKCLKHRELEKSKI